MAATRANVGEHAADSAFQQTESPLFTLEFDKLKVLGTRPMAIPNYYLVTYAPLVMSSAGREASSLQGLPPFIDGSIRREPDLEHEYPAISCLCRADNFTPRLKLGDIVGYMTKKAKYKNPSPHRRLTAILKVRDMFPTHAEAATWYRTCDMRLPNNCMVSGNDSIPLSASNRMRDDNSLLSDAKAARNCDAQYRLRAKSFGTFVVCRVLFRDLSWNAPVVTDDTLIAAFGRIPATQNPGNLSSRRFRQLLELLGIGAVLPSP
jgi:hypothetical protein